MQEQQDKNNEAENTAIEPEELYAVEPEDDGEENSLKKDRLKQEIDRLKKEKEEYLQGWQRERANFANFQKDQEKQRGEFKAAALRDILLSIVELLDSLELAEVHAPEEIRKNAWFAGIVQIQKQTQQILLRYGVEEILIKEGDVFQPETHEAIEQRESDKPSGTILSVLQRGYKLGDKVLRAARVQVAR